jgi:hypothetical protein
MIAFVEERPSGRWLVVLNECGDLIYTCRVECGSKVEGILVPMVSKDQYDADRQAVRAAAGTNKVRVISDAECAGPPGVPACPAVTPDLRSMSGR